MSRFTPLADDAASLDIAELAIENSTDVSSLYGPLDITRDTQGLAHAQALKLLLDQVVQLLETQKDLPEALPPASKPRKITNPFG